MCCVSPPRDAVAGALMPASMILPVECPSSSPIPPLDSSSSSCVSDEECPPVPPEAEDRVSPNPWQDKKGEVRNTACICHRMLSLNLNLVFPFSCHTINLLFLIGELSFYLLHQNVKSVTLDACLVLKRRILTVFLRDQAPSSEDAITPSSAVTPSACGASSRPFIPVTDDPGAASIIAETMTKTKEVSVCLKIKIQRKCSLKFQKFLKSKM